MKNKILILFIVGMFLFSMTSVLALESSGTGKQYSNFTINQICNDATFITLSTIQYPDKTINNVNTNMTFINSGAFQYNFSDTTQLGRYDYCGISDGCENTFCGYFEVTSSGDSLGLNQGIILVAMLGIIALFFGLARTFGKNKWKIALGFDIFSVLMGVILLNSIRIIATQSSALGSMAEAGLIIGIIALIFLFLYLFIYALIEVFFYFKRKRRQKWDISENPY